MFDDVEEAKRWADEWVLRRENPLFAGAIGILEADHFERFNTEYGRWIAQFEIQYAHLIRAITAVNYVDRSDWPPHRSIQYVILAYNVRTHWSAADRVCRGYYEDSISLTRSGYEAFVRSVFVSCHPDDAYAVLVRNPARGARTFNLTNFLRDDLGLSWEAKYSALSRFAHANSHGALQALTRAIDREGTPETFGFGLPFDDRLCDIALPLMNFVLLAHLRFTARVLRATSSPTEDELSEVMDESLQLLTYQLSSHPSAYWQGVAKDLDVLFAMLDVADQGGDWRSYLSSTRA